jgi:hypothetical protein
MHPVNSQDKFFKILTHPLLKELVCRFDSGLIATHITAARSTHKELEKSIRVESEWVYTSKSLFIDYFLDNIRIYHFSIHLYPQYLNPKSNGPIHFKLNSHNGSKSTLSIPIRVRGSAQGSNSLIFNVKNTSNQSSQHMREIEVLRTILNAYFNKEHSYYLGNRLCAHNTVDNKTIKNMYSKIQNIISQPIATRRQPRNRR